MEPQVPVQATMELQESYRWQSHRNNRSIAHGIRNSRNFSRSRQASTNERENDQSTGTEVTVGAPVEKAHKELLVRRVGVQTKRAKSCRSLSEARERRSRASTSSSS
ncbi:hypothetical protein F444_15284 [Phytophthora nicotianae P1976]|uniref:Uncharacterized protein n=1 Tax=Phytophthora nicotianae P1976 TaxID=1317066 RepID=A0A080ZMG8_PHYNI|nr:hypothetical protein F444_15284 [Phytophthora nicotianae P1976]